VRRGCGTNRKRARRRGEKNEWKETGVMGGAGVYLGDDGREVGRVQTPGPVCSMVRDKVLFSERCVDVSPVRHCQRHPKPGEHRGGGGGGGGVEKGVVRWRRCSSCSPQCFCCIDECHHKQTDDVTSTTWRLELLLLPVHQCVPHGKAGVEQRTRAAALTPMTQVLCTTKRPDTAHVKAAAPGPLIAINTSAKPCTYFGSRAHTA
jgi:hypothetical protein